MPTMMTRLPSPDRATVRNHRDQVLPPPSTPTPSALWEELERVRQAAEEQRTALVQAEDLAASRGE